MRRRFAWYVICLLTVLLFSNGLSEEAIGISGGQPDEAVVFLKLLDDESFTASVMCNGEWISANGRWKAEKQGLTLESENRPEMNQKILFNNGLGVFIFGDTSIHISLAEDAIAFFESFGNEVPEGMPGEIITPTPSPTPEPTPTPTVSPTPSPTPAPVIYDSINNIYRAVILEVQADSYIVGDDPSAYIPERMIDGNEQTAWQFSTKTSDLKNTYAYFTFTGAVDVNQLWIKNGFWTITKGYDQYTRNSRPKEIGIAFRYEGSDEWTDKQTVKLKDDKERRDWQKINLGEHREVTGIRFRILSIYKGSKFPKDVCISEVMFVDN